MPCKVAPRREQTLTLVFILVFVPTLSGGIIGQWSRVESIDSGKHIRVVYYVEGVKSKRSHKLGGWFSSATVDSITVLLSDGSSKTIERRLIRKVAVKAPILKRTGVWVMTGLTLGLLQLTHYGCPDCQPFGGDILTHGTRTARGLAYVALPVWVFSIFQFSHNVIYATPRY